MAKRLIAKPIEADPDRRTLTLEIKPQYMYQVFQLDPEKEYSIVISKKKDSRSLQQNKYLWALIHEIGTAVSGRAVDDEDIYAQILEKANAEFDYLTCVPEAEERLKRNKAFRLVRYVGRANGMNIYKCYYGTSQMNKKAMSEVIETALDWAMELGLDHGYWRELLHDS